jgi:DNA repair exonuclease SbcCD ATPase subunit
MPSVTLLNKPKMDADCAVSGLKFVEIPKMSFTVEVDFDKKIFAKIKDDAILIEDMNKAARKAYDTICAGITNKIKIFDKLFVGMDEQAAKKGTKKEDVAKQLAGLNAALEQDRRVGEAIAREEVKAVWEGYIKRNKDYSKYKIKIGVTIFGAVAGLVTSIALMATSPFTGGASAAFSIIGMFKSAVTLVKEIGSAWLEVESSQKVLEKQIIVVEKAAQSVAGRRANEITAMVLDNFLGIANPSLKSCESALDTVEQKLNGIEIKTHEASKLLNKIIDEQERLQKEFLKDAATQLAKQAPNQAKAQLKDIEDRLDDYLVPSRIEVGEQIEKVMAMYDRFKDAHKVTGDLKKRILTLKAAVPKSEENLMTFARNVLTLSSFPLGAMSGNGMAKTASDLASGLGSTAGSFAYDKITSKVLGGSLLA